MEKLYLSGTQETPEIVFDKTKSEFRVSGKSYIEDARAHYMSVISWLEEYHKNPNPFTTFKFELEYVNTSSSKIIHDILNILENMHLDEHDVSIEWHYYPEDEDILDLGQECRDL